MFVNKLASLYRLPCSLNAQAFKPTFSSFLYSTQASTPKEKSGSGYRSIFIGATVVAAAAGGYFFSNSTPQKSISPQTTQEPPLDPKSFKPFKLSQIIPVSDNTSIFRFQLAPGQALNLPCASFVLTHFKDEKTKDVSRPYTPISKENDKGFFDLLVKKYPGGPMSSHIFGLKPGDELNVKGPLVKYEYKPNMHKKVAMVAGGTGITPMLQVIHKILDNPHDQTKISLIFGNLSENDILLKDQLDRLEEKNPDRLKVVYTLDHPPSGWKGEKGFVSQDMITKYFPAPTEENIKIFTCGPPPMVASIAGPKAPDYSQGELAGVLKNMGYSKDQVFKF